MHFLELSIFDYQQNLINKCTLYLANRIEGCAGNAFFVYYVDKRKKIQNQQMIELIINRVLYIYHLDQSLKLTFFLEKIYNEITLYRTYFRTFYT